MSTGEILTLLFSGILCVASVVLALFTWKLWKIGSGQHEIQKAQQLIQEKQREMQEETLGVQLDPELGLAGRWSWSGPDEHGCSEARFEGWLYNPGPSPIVVTGRDFEADQSCGGIDLWDRKSLEDYIELKRTQPKAEPMPFFPPFLIPGYGNKRLTITCKAKDLKKVTFTYSTSTEQDKVAEFDPF